MQPCEALFRGLVNISVERNVDNTTDLSQVHIVLILLKVIHKEKAKEQEEVIEEAKTAAIEASKETLKVADVPVYDTEKDEGIAV